LIAIAPMNSRLVAQNPDTMMPEASASKAKQILAQMFDAMGGAAYLHVHELQCSGRRSQFGHNNDLTAYMEFKEYWRYPDKNRTDLGKKGNIIDVFNGNEGWTMDHDGVSEEPADKVDDFREQLLKDPQYLFRYRLNEEGMVYRYGGTDLIDLKPVDWVELRDRSERTFRIAVARDTHLMVRFVVVTQDEVSRERVDEVTSYANYHTLDGVATPLQISRTRNDRRVFQAFYDSCTYNPNLAPDFFTKSALDQRFQQVGSRADKKKAAKVRE
jgi:outer membrane lipoprotein-sorting protein